MTQTVTADDYRRQFLALKDQIRRLENTLQGKRTVRGAINSSGVKLRGEGFTSSRTGVGTYVITFDQAFGDLPSGGGWMGNGGGTLHMVRQTALSASAATLNVRQQDASNNSSDQPVDFIFEGPI